MSHPVAAWYRTLAAYAAGFTHPSYVLSCELTTAWILCPGRRTVTRMIGLLEPRSRRAHDADHRFLRRGDWRMSDLWPILARGLVATFAPFGIIPLDLDDTLFHKTGRRIQGAGIFRDAVRSSGKTVVYALGLNLVVLTLRVTPPWGGEPLGLPIGVRLYRQGGPSHLDRAEQMLCAVATWFPDRRFALCCDGAYASLAGRHLSRTQVASRMRRDAALYELPPKRRKGQRRRPAKKAKRLPTPEQLARRQRKGWARVHVDMRGRKMERLILSRQVPWYKACQDRCVLLVIVRNPQGKQPDDFFFTTELEDGPVVVAGRYNGRWSIEDTFRNVNQSLGGKDPQTWKYKGPERAASLSLWLYAVTWSWYIATQGVKHTWSSLP